MKSIIKSSPPSISGAVASIAILLAVPASGAIIVQELFDAIAGGDQTLNGLGDSSASTGMTGLWAINGENQNIMVANNFNVVGGDPGLPGPSFSNGQDGGLWHMTGSWSTSIYATRALASTISFATDQTLYFSVRLNNEGNSAMGIGLASGAGGSSEFVGAGFSWDEATSIGGPTDGAGNAAYISYGTLGDEAGPYGIRVHEAAGSVNGYGLLVGRITISSTGADLIDIKRYAPGDTIEQDPSLVTWSASDSFDSDMEATHLLLWLNGGGGNAKGEIDAIRFGTTWADVTAVPETGSTALCALGLALAMRRRRH